MMVIYILITGKVKIVMIIKYLVYNVNMVIDNIKIIVFLIVLMIAKNVFFMIKNINV